ncbi:MAG TPA: ABC transporter permease [Halanaerobiales bacterium]|nr:ABC transporter permease [Halanaerobiales bacterium]
MNLKWKYLIKRTGQMILTMWIISTVLFFIFRLMPGNPLVAYINPTFTEKQQEILMEQFGLNKPLWMQYFIYLKNLLQGKLGQSFFFKEPVTNVIAKVLPNTIYLMLTSLIMAYVIGIIGGIFLAWKRGETIETYGLVFTLFTRSAPQFWVGMLLLAVFSFQLDIFPSGGVASAGIVYGSELEKLFSLQFYKHLFLPALTLTIYLLGLPLLLMRSNMLDVMDEAYVQMAKMRGVNKIRVMFKYAARNAFLPVITAMAVGIGYAMGGNVVIEKIFSWPGLGRLLVKAVSTSDYPLAQGAFILIAAIIIFMNFFADIFYNILDPRVNIEDRK